MHATPWVHNARHPDTSSLERLVAHERFKGLSGEALAVELWKYTIDPITGFYHYWSPSDRESTRPGLGTEYVRDPLKLINSFGYMLCGTVAQVYANLCEAAGLEVRVVGVVGHCLNEVKFDGAWHLLDCDLRAYHRTRDGSRIASLKELLVDPSLVSNPSVKSEPIYYVSDRPPDSMAQACYAPKYGDWMPHYVIRFHAQDFVLRPGETLTRHAEPVENRWSYPPHWVDDRKKYEKEWTGKGPAERFPPHRRYGNACFEYRPDLTNASRDFELGVWDVDGLEPGPKGLCVVGAERGAAAFLVYSPWVISGVNEDGIDPEKKSRALVVKLGLEIPKGKTGAGSLSYSLDGTNWVEVARRSDSGTLEVDLTAQFELRYRGILRVELEGAAIATSFETELWAQTSANSYPHLTGPEARMQYHGGDAKGRRTLTEWWRSALEPDDAAFASGIFSGTNLKRGESPQVRLSPQYPSQPWSAVFRVKPNLFKLGQIVRAWVWASLVSIKGEHDMPRTGPQPKAKLEVSASPNGPWELVKAMELPSHPQGYHFSLEGDYQPPRRVEALYLRVTSDLPGMEAGAALACQLPPYKGKLPPLEILHHWESAGCARTHRECIDDPMQPREYSVLAGTVGVKDVKTVYCCASTRG